MGDGEFGREVWIEFTWLPLSVRTLQDQPLEVANRGDCLWMGAVIG